ncbi:hypothetical protein Agub_g956, partial [Astrephomene gubernaculifera]
MAHEKPIPRLIAKVVCNAHAISFTLIIAAVLGVFALPLLDRPIRFEEKGLLPGFAHATISDSFNALLPDALRIARSAAAPAAFQRPGAAASLASALRRAGLPATQLSRPTVTAPSGATPGSAPSPCRCANVHTVIPSRRGEGLEALALVTPVAFSPQRADPALEGRNQSAGGAELGLLVGAALAL